MIAVWYDKAMLKRFCGICLLGIGIGVGCFGVYASVHIFAAHAAALSAKVQLFPDPARRVSAGSDTPPPGKMNMVIVGDIMLDRYVRTTIAKYGAAYPFAAMTKYLRSDLTIGNLEGPFTTSRSVATVSRLIFTFDPALARTLKANDFFALSLANNHTLNFGQSGLDNTRRVLRGANMVSFGDPKNRSGFTRVLTINGKKVGLVGYHGLVAGFDTVLSDVRRLRPKVDTLIVIPHWGNEYQLGINAKTQIQAHQLIDAGADFVFGSHPHVVEPVEIYKKKFIAYSLGNFIFDQDFSTETTQGLMLRLHMVGQKTTIEFFPVSIAHDRAAPLIGAPKDKLLQRLANTSIITASQKASLAKGQLVLP